MSGPSPISLVHRGLVLFGLILRGVHLYAYWIWVSRGSRFHGLGDDDWLERQRRFARAFVDAATRLRGGLIKIGQVASLRVDVMPDGVTDELARLQDRVEPHPFDEIAARVEAELGASSGECAPWIVGPKLIMSIPGMRSPSKPHSSPAWTAVTWGSLPQIVRYTSRSSSVTAELGLGSQPG